MNSNVSDNGGMHIQQHDIVFGSIIIAHIKLGKLPQKEIIVRVTIQSWVGVLYPVQIKN